MALSSASRTDPIRGATRLPTSIAELDRGVLGRFKWSSQRFMRSYDDQMEAAIGSFW